MKNAGKEIEKERNGLETLTQIISKVVSPIFLCDDRSQHGCINAER